MAKERLMLPGAMGLGGIYTDTLPEPTREAAEWLINQKLSKDSDVVSAFNSRVSSCMADRIMEAEEQDDFKIRQVAGQKYEKALADGKIPATEVPPAFVLEYREREQMFEKARAVWKFKETLAKLSPQQQNVVTQILENLDEGRLVWNKGWDASNVRDVFGAPNNPITGTVYSGINAIFLAMQGYSDPRWITFNQMQEKDWRFKTGANGESLAKNKGAQIEFYSAYDKLAKKPFDRNEPGFAGLTPEEQQQYFRDNVSFPRKSYTVFNASLIDGIEPFKITEEDKLKRNETMERIIANSEASVSYDGGNRAYYRPSSDSIHLPPRAAFKDAEELYGTASHEIGHSTGHYSRLKRDLSGGFGSAKYAQEELRAEFASALMCIQYGVTLSPDHIKNHAAYIQHWKEETRSNPQSLIDAIKDAGKIVAYVNERYAGTGATAEIKTEETKLAPSDAAPLGAQEVASPKAVADKADMPLADAKGVAETKTVSGGVPAWIEQKRVKTLAGIEANIPPEMRALPVWAAFNTSFDKESGSYKKSIWDCNQSSKKWAKSNDSTTWTTFEKALSFAKLNGCDGLSFALTKENRIFCVDLDGAKTDGKYSPLAWEISNNAKCTYAERSVSGKGLHVFGIRGESLDNHPVFNGTMGNKSGDGKLEFFDGSRFMSVTGDIFTHAKKELISFGENDKLVAVIKGQLSEKAAPSTEALRTSSTPSSSSVSDVIERIRKSAKAKEFEAFYSGQNVLGDHSRSDMSLCGIAAFFSGGDANIVREIFVSSGLYRDHRQGKSVSYVDRTVNRAIENNKTQIKPPSGGKKPGKG